MNFAGAALPLHQDGLAAAAAHAGVDPAVLWSVIVVETAGCGFLPDRRPAILFERHVFSRRTGARFDASHPEISGPPGGYGPSGARQFARLEAAVACDRRAALESASWGLGQIMGFNAAPAGFGDVETMVAQMMQGENEQILAMASFMRASGMHAALQRRDWSGFARRYNGPGFAANRYDDKLAAAHTRASGGGLPNLTIRGVQLLLSYHGFNPGKIDGAVGDRTRAAIAAFTAANSLPDMSGSYQDLHAALLERLPPAAAAQQAGAPPPTAARIAAPNLRLAQSLLAYLGGKPGPVDGKPGPRTRAAIAEYQKSQGAAATGQADPALLAALEAETRRRFGKNRSADVRLVQQLLALKGFDTGGIDGLVGPKTTAALAAFARARRGVTAVATDPKVLDALFLGD